MIPKTLVTDIETTGLTGLTDKITCITCQFVDEDKPRSWVGPNEEKNISGFFDFVNSNKDDPITIATYNGYSFDLPFMRLRALKHNIPTPLCIRSDKNKIDLYHYLMRSRSGKQDQLFDLLGLEHFGNGAECVKCAEVGDYETILKHCESDVSNLRTVLNKLFALGYQKDELY